MTSCARALAVGHRALPQTAALLRRLLAVSQLPGRRHPCQLVDRTVFLPGPDQQAHARSRIAQAQPDYGRRSADLVRWPDRDCPVACLHSSLGQPLLSRLVIDRRSPSCRMRAVIDRPRPPARAPQCIRRRRAPSPLLSSPFSSSRRHHVRRVRHAPRRPPVCPSAHRPAPRARRSVLPSASPFFRTAGMQRSCYCSQCR